VEAIPVFYPAPVSRLLVRRARLPAVVLSGGEAISGADFQAGRARLPDLGERREAVFS
jgi:hypothetical protein